ncbi:DUF4837 family protein [Flavobacteriaceae bacterium Ap0902]|nr:DUF4837 family protein [Flavobacteriaceae bacterium Ap0902]
MLKKYTFLVFIISLFALTSCGDENEPKYYAPSSGPINLISVFSSEEMYQELEPALTDSLIFGKIFPGLYYPPEIMFATRQFNSEDFNRFKTTRLVLDVKQGEPSITFEKNAFAKPQAYVQVAGNNSEEILNLLRQNQDSLINFYRSVDREFLLDDYKSNARQEKEKLNNLGVSLLIPKDFRVAESNDSFVWFRKDQFNTIHNKDERGGIATHQSQDILNIMVYKVPFAKTEVTKNDFYAIQDSIMRIYTKGDRTPVERYLKTNQGNDSIKVLMTDHIQTEMTPMLEDFYDFTKISEDDNHIVYETQGYWSMTLSQMGGPYTAKLILDKQDKTLYIADGIMFAPLNQGNSKKRDYITSLESLFTTFMIK